MLPLSCEGIQRTFANSRGGKQMADLKENIENEIHAAHDEYLKMDSHIKLYITEMEQAL